MILCNNSGYSHMQRENEPDVGTQKVAVITGSSKGIGKSIAIEFAKEGTR